MLQLNYKSKLLIPYQLKIPPYNLWDYCDWKLQLYTWKHAQKQYLNILITTDKVETIVKKKNELSIHVPTFDFQPYGVFSIAKDVCSNTSVFALILLSHGTNLQCTIFMHSVISSIQVTALSVLKPTMSVETE